MRHFLREEISPIQDELYEEFLDNFAHTGYVWVNAEESVKIQEIVESEYLQACRIAGEVMGAKTGYIYFSANSDDTVKRYLLDYEGVTPEELTKRGTSSLSLAEGVRDKLIGKGKALEFLHSYTKLKEAKSLNGRIKGINKRLDMSEDITSDLGNKLGKLHYELSPLKNRRVGTKDYNVIGIPKDKGYILEAKKGVTIIEGDLPQADLRIALELVLSSPEIKRIFAGEEDAYLGFAKAVYHMMKIDLDLKWFKAYRQDLKAVTLGPLYGKVDAQGEIQKNHVKGINKLLSHDNKYMKFKQNIIDKRDAGLPIFSESYFGYRQEIVGSSKGTGSASYTGDVLNAALNSPIQTGTSELIILIVNSICQELRNCGLEQGEDFGVLVVRYDEPIFWIKDEYLLDYGWIFKDHESIVIDGFHPIPIKFEANKKYHIKDDKMNEVYKQSCEIHKDKINTTLKEFEDTVNTYIPVLGIRDLYLGTSELSDGVLCVLYDKSHKERFYIKLSNTSDVKLSDSQIFSRVCSVLAKNRKFIREEEFVDTIRIFNPHIEGSESFNDEIIVEAIKCDDENILYSNHIAYVASYLAMKKSGKDTSMYSQDILYKFPKLMTPESTSLKPIQYIKVL